MTNLLRDGGPVVIDRDQQIDAVIDLIMKATNSQGALIVITDPSALGTTTHIQAVFEKARTISTLGNAQFAIGTCIRETAGLDAYQPFVDLLTGLLDNERRDAGVSTSMRSILTETGPDIAHLIPHIGAPLNERERTFSVLTGLGLGLGPDRRSAASVLMTTQFEHVLMKMAAEFAPLVLVIGDAQWIDESSCYVLQRLVRSIKHEPIVLILTLRREVVDGDHPLARLLSESRGHGVLEIHLPAPNADHIGEVIEPVSVESDRSQLDQYAVDAAFLPRKALIELAQRYESGDDPVKAAKHYLLAARSSFLDGAGTETAELSRRAVLLAQLIPAETDHHDRLFAEAVALNLAATELEWGVRSATPRGDDPRSLIAAAEAAASRSRDPLLAAQLKFLAAKVLLTIESRTNAVAKLEEALQDARTAADPLTEFLVLSELGHHRAGGGVETALQTLRQAMDLLQRRLQPNRTTLAIAPADLDRQYHHLLQVIGVAEFDLGNFDEAIRLLEASRSGVAASKTRFELERILNFLGQAYTAAGQFEQAEQALTEAIDLEIDQGVSGASYPWRVYNRGQLGKLYIEWERFGDAAPILTSAWEETQELTTASLKPLVANFYAEALIHPESPIRDEAKAESLLKATAQSAGQAGFFRSRVQSHSMLGQLSLLQNNPHAAFAHSSAAVEELERHGILPALRAEEIYYHHARVCQSTGQTALATSYLERAHDVVMRKATTLNNLEDRRRFLNRVPLCRDILAAMASPEAPR